MAEQRILGRLLSVEFDGVQELRAQAAHVSGVEPNCTCGCPSITPTIDRSLAPPASGLRMLPTELQELERQNGIERSVICFLNEDGYLANLECVFYDDAIDEWPDADQCAVLLRDSDHYLTAVRLPSGARRPTRARPRLLWIPDGAEGQGCGKAERMARNLFGGGADHAGSGRVSSGPPVRDGV